MRKNKVFFFSFEYSNFLTWINKVHFMTFFDSSLILPRSIFPTYRLVFTIVSVRVSRSNVHSSSDNSSDVIFPNDSPRVDGQGR